MFFLPTHIKTILSKVFKVYIIINHIDQLTSNTPLALKVNVFHIMEDCLQRTNKCTVHLIRLPTTTKTKE